VTFAGGLTIQPPRLRCTNQHPSEPVRALIFSPDPPRALRRILRRAYPDAYTYT
jgi:hypothetical protein